MKTYIGTKIINAEPMMKNYFDGMVKGDCILFGTIDQEGYLVIYEDGYKSWSPKDVFDRSYREVTEAEKNLLK